MGRFSLDTSTAWETGGRREPDTFGPQDRQIQQRAFEDCRVNGKRWQPPLNSSRACDDHSRRVYDAVMRVLAEQQVAKAEKLVAADPSLSSDAPRGQHTPSVGGRKSADFFGGAIRTGGAMGGTDSQGGDSLGTGSGGASVVVSMPDASTPATPLEALPWYQRRAYALPGSPTYGVLAGIAAALAVGGYVWHKRARR